MFGFRDEFDYAECAGCGGLQILHVPADLGKYYPADYYSFRPAERLSPLKRFLRNRWYRHQVGDFDPVGELIARVKPHRAELLALRSPRVERTAAILDVGSGSSGLLDQLADIGFTNLTGVDPFLPEGATARAPIRLLRTTIDQLESTYDVIVFNHSLEHMADPVSALQHAAQRLSAGGRVIVRTPIANRT